MAKNRIVKNIAEELFGVYGFRYKQLNFYTYRLYKEEDKKHRFFDWYHTTGSLVSTISGRHNSLKKFSDPEDVCLYIIKKFFT